MLKLGEAMPSGENCSMDGDLHVVEFALGGESNKVGHIYNRKKKKVITMIQYTKDCQVKKNVCYEGGRFLCANITPCFHEVY
jgi:hypothetical protein